MSIIERALLKRKGVQPDDTAVMPVEPRTPRKPDQTFVVASDLGTAVVELETPTLRAAGMLATQAVEIVQAGQYRSVRRQLLDRVTGDDGTRFIAVTSPTSGDGKTYTAFNLAVSFAKEPDHRVLLVDADLPRHQLSERLGIVHLPGLADCLAKEESLATAVLATSFQRLYLLPAGLSRGDGAELLGGTRFQGLFRDLLVAHPDLIIILDSGPVLQSAEAEMLCRNVPRVILVVRSGRSSRKVVQDAVARVGKQSGLDVLLNAWEPSLFEDDTVYGRYYGSMDPS